MIYIVLGLIAGGLGYLISRSIAASVINAIFIAACSYIGLPTLALDFGDLYVLLVLSLIIPAATALCLKDNPGAQTRGVMGIASMVGVIVVCLALRFLTTSVMIRDDSYQALLGDVEVKEFTAAMAPIDQSQIRTIDRALATRRAHEILGSDPGLGSRVSVGQFSIQNVGGKLTWVAPLEHTGFFKWLLNDGTPGYIRVSANNLRDAALVQTLNNEKITMSLGLSSFFGDDLIRFVYQNGYSTQGYTDPTLEIDDTGRPYWIMTKYEKRVGFAGEEATGTIVVNPQTREINEYSIANTPEWIDRIQPENFVYEQIANWGELIHGYWNFSNQDVQTATPGMSVIYTAEGRSMWYTGISAYQNQEGTIGFMLVDTKTKKATMFKQNGASELAAERAMESKFSEKKDWSVTAPILHNVAGVPTYIATIKDGYQNFAGMAIMHVEERQSFAMGDDLQDALRRYARIIERSKARVAPGSEIAAVTISGLVLRTGTEVIEGSSIFYVLLDNHPNQKLQVSPKVNPEILVTQVGDNVTVEADNTDEPVARVRKFDNAGVNLAPLQN